MTQDPLLIQDPENHTLFSGTYLPHPSRPRPNLGVPAPPPPGGGVRELACRLQVQGLLSPGSLLVQNFFRNAHTRRVQGQQYGKKLINIS